jgi:hypothetical protein
VATSAGSTAKIVWSAWFQGLENAPYVVRQCHESWLARNPGWRVVCLDETSLQEFAAADYAAGNLSRLPAPARADLLRLDLLSRHGGVWADATCFCVRPLDDWLPANTESGFFAFSRPGPDRVISSWFLAAEPGDVLISRLFELMLRYWGDNAFHQDKRRMTRKALTRLLRRSPSTRAWWFSSPIRDLLAVSPYYALHYGFEKLVREDPECADIWRRTPKISADGPHRLYRAGLLGRASAELRREIDRSEVPVYKTTWRADEPIPDDSLLGYLLQSARR